ncbi:MAG: SRPBCC domain-containing protein [Pseudotabrizicola sp.]|uniref:SRPBCC domain-containing protein n=1 Tax=Pseudotabrizicola sp. TaxID=2939647 RepID=UPI002725BDA4|nr:SRPBCC domain-containing protein [Pseudotabrizicola sp.]MDO8883384.1 SRPBCC domain-containing protein [Pseudotabrizicola sp.]MDP2080911.1 SRPBCC domain-containing protein [Pseudotabrizicola sp.]MDZ7572687.1 SRPBCC domain-containing protein [Pseudotabrizicola sp.]
MSGRSIALSRLIAAPVAKVWRCWTDPALLPQWFGPDGYSCRTHDIDLRTGGHWLFDMTGPDGKVWPNRHRYTRMEAYQIDFLLDSGADDESPNEVVMTLTANGDATRIRYEMTFPSPAARAMAVGFGAVELGHQTLGKLAVLAAKI